MKQHYTSKELREAMKEDELEELLNKTSSWFRRYQQHMTLAVLAVVAMGVVYLIYHNYQQGKVQQAADAYSRAAERMDGKNWQEAASQFDAVARDFGGTGEAMRAQAAAAQAYFYQGDYAKAMERYQAMVGSGDATLAGEGITGVGMVLEAQNKTAEAEAHYHQALQKHADSPMAQVWRYRLAYCCEQQGQIDKAVEGYQGIDKDSGMREEADRRLLWLKAPSAVVQR